jgi:hypothetical protein
MGNWRKYSTITKFVGTTFRPRTRSHDYIRHGTTSLVTAQNIAIAKVIGSLYRGHRAAEFNNFLIRYRGSGPTRPDPQALGWHRPPARISREVPLSRRSVTDLQSEMVSWGEGFA